MDPRNSTRQMRIGRRGFLAGGVAARSLDAAVRPPMGSDLISRMTPAHGARLIVISEECS